MDTISKFNYKNFNQLSFIDKMEVKIYLNSLEGNIIRRYLILVKIFKLLFNKKLILLDIIKKKEKKKKNIIYSIVVGLTIRKYDMYESLNYFYNVINNMAFKNNEKIIYKKINDIFVIKYNNLNYILGDNEISLYTNIFCNFNYYIYFKKRQKNSIKIYEKIFFKKVFE